MASRKTTCRFWWDALKEKNIQVRRAAFKIIESLGPDARDATPALIDAMGEEDKGQAKGVEASLLAIGPDAVPLLIEALKSANVKTRLAAAAQTLGHINLDGERLTHIAALLADERPEARAAR